MKSKHPLELWGRRLDISRPVLLCDAVLKAFQFTIIMHSAVDNWTNSAFGDSQFLVGKMSFLDSFSILCAFQCKVKAAKRRGSGELQLSDAYLFIRSGIQTGSHVQASRAPFQAAALHLLCTFLWSPLNKRIFLHAKFSLILEGIPIP